MPCLGQAEGLSRYSKLYTKYGYHSGRNSKTQYVLFSLGLATHGVSEAKVGFRCNSLYLYDRQETNWDETFHLISMTFFLTRRLAKNDQSPMITSTNISIIPLEDKSSQEDRIRTCNENSASCGFPLMKIS